MNLKDIKNHFKKTDEKLYRYMKTLDFASWLDSKPRANSKYFESLCRSIIYQQLSGKAASTIWERVVSMVGSVEPDSILAHKDEQFRGVGASWAKAKYIRDLAQKVKDKEVSLENLDSLDDESVIEELMKVKGIGKWTAEMFLMFTLQRQDIFSLGDLGLKRGIEKVYGVKDPGQEKMLEIASPWSPYKTYGSITLWHSLEVD